MTSPAVWRCEFQQVENESIFFKDPEVNILRPKALDGAGDGTISEHRRALFDHLNQQHAMNGALNGAYGKNASHLAQHRQAKADWPADPDIDEANGARVHEWVSGFGFRVSS